MTIARADILRTALAAGLSLWVGSAFAQDTVKIGLSITQTPPGSVVQGAQALQGIQFATDYLNEKGGILGKRIELAIEDDQGTAERGRTAGERLITRDKVIAMTGQISSTSVLAQTELAKQYNVPLINTNGWSDDIRLKGYPQVFNPGPYTSRLAVATIETLLAMKASSVVLIADNTDAGFLFQKSLTAAMKEKAPSVKFRSQILDRQGKDYLPAVLELKKEQPSVIISYMVAPAGYIFINQLYEQGVTPSKETVLFEASGIVDNPDFWKNVRGGGNMLLAYGAYHPKIQLSPIGEEFRARFLAKVPKTVPGRLYFQGVDSILLLAEAAKQAGSTDAAKLIPALQKINMTVTRGNLSFDATPGATFQQWADVPYVIFQVTKVDQRLEDTTLLMQAGKPFDFAAMQKP